jgi:hypothetical protein
MPAGQYELSLRLSSWSGGDVNTSISIVRGSQPGPRAAILGDAESYSAISDPLIIQGYAERSECEGAADGALEYKWSIIPAVCMTEREPIHQLEHKLPIHQII